MMKVYKEIRNELKTYGNDLDTKEEIILLTKTDVLPEDDREKIIKKKIKEFEKMGNKVYAVTLYDDESVKSFADVLTAFLNIPK